MHNYYGDDMATVTKQKAKIDKETELELVAIKIRQQQLEAKIKGLKYETHEEVKKRYGFK